MGRLKNITYEQQEDAIMTKMLLYFVLNIMAMAFMFEFFPGWSVNIVQIITLSGFLWNLFKLSALGNIESRYLRNIFIVFTLWVIYIVLNGLIIEYNYIKEYLFETYRGLPFLVPLIILTPVYKPLFIRKLWSLSYLLGQLFLILFPFYLILGLYNRQAFSEMYIWIFATGAGFMLLTSKYHTRKEIILSCVVVFMAFILSTVLARRNIMLTYAGFMFAGFWIYLFYNKTIELRNKVFAVALSLFLLCGGLYMFLSNQETVFSKISERAGLNTRQEVFLGFTVEMNKDVKYFLFGKGINGTYYAPGIDKAFTGIHLSYRNQDYRFHIENGYLQFILNGGLVYLFLFLAILIPAGYLGMFRSNNLFTKGCATVIFLWLIDMIPFGVASFSFRYLLVWVCVGICFSKRIRSMSEDEFTDLIYIDTDEDSVTGKLRSR